MTDHARAIENLLYTYAECMDLGNYEGIAELFREGSISSTIGKPSEGYDEVLALYQSSTRLYPDNNTPHTKHVTTNAIIEVEGDSTAKCRSYFTVLQQTPDLPLQAIISGRYHDEFERVGGTWRFTKRKIFPDLLGDLSQHLLFDASVIK